MLKTEKTTKNDDDSFIKNSFKKKIVKKHCILL